MKQLNGKAKEDFGIFVFKKYKIATWDDFYKLPLVCQQALVIDFFDSVGIYISIEVYNKPDATTWYETYVSTKSLLDWSLTYDWNELFNSRPEATEKAIEKAVEIFNQK